MPGSAPAQAWISAARDLGLDELRAAIARAVRPAQPRRTLHVQLSAGAIRSLLYQRNAVREERQQDDGSWEIDVELAAPEIAKLAGESRCTVEETWRLHRLSGAARLPRMPVRNPH